MVLLVVGIRLPMLGLTCEWVWRWIWFQRGMVRLHCYCVGMRANGSR